MFMPGNIVFDHLDWIK